MWFPCSFLGGSGMGKLKVTVITLPESLSWPEESMYKHYKLKLKLLFCSEIVYFINISGFQIEVSAVSLL